MNRNPPSTERLAIEKALQDATFPLTAGDISFRTGLDIYVVRSHLNGGAKRGRLTNVGRRAGSSLYIWGTEMPKKKEIVITRFVPTGTYDGSDLRRAPARGDAAMRAYGLPSRGF